MIACVFASLTRGEARSNVHDRTEGQLSAVILLKESTRFFFGERPAVEGKELRVPSATAGKWRPPSRPRLEEERHLVVEGRKLV